MYERTSTIERADGKPVAKTGQVTGILATSGEASDGHILNMDGGTLKAGSPLLFNHDAFDGNLGSWVSFEKGGEAIRGTAQIEMDGIGAKADWRQDVAFMVDQGHIPAFSLRWDATKIPTRRVNLSKDHPAFVDADKEQDFNKLYGLYFDKWRMLEGSIVTLPADQGALIGRMRDAKTGAREHWSRILERMAIAKIGPVSGAESDDAFSREVLASFDHINIGELEPIELGDGRTFYVPHELAELRSEREPTVAPVEKAASVVAEPDASASMFSRDDISAILREEVATIRKGIRDESRELLYHKLGRVKQ